MSTIPVEGARAPAFTLASNDGEKIRLSDLKGGPVVVYFYPKDNTPGCTVEARGFRAKAKAFEEAGATILGISPDSVETHCAFADKYRLPFPLLSDPKHVACEKYGVWVEKSLFGRKYWGLRRATFLIDAHGKIARVWPKVRPIGHAAEVLQALREIQ